MKHFSVDTAPFQEPWWLLVPPHSEAFLRVKTVLRLYRERMQVEAPAYGARNPRSSQRELLTIKKHTWAHPTKEWDGFGFTAYSLTGKN